jgi:hypothetical protein
MKRFIYIAEIKLDEKRCDEIENWGILVEDFVDSVLSDHGKDRGFVIKARSIETDNSKYELAVDAVFDSIKTDAFEALENDLLNNRMCLGGNCEV